MGLLSAIADPNISQHLLRDEGEDIVDEVRHHWVVYIVPVLEILLAIAFLAVTPFVPVEIAWLTMILAGGVLLHAVWRALKSHMDRFVITNMRVFRVNGVFNRHMATMPLSRILDITVVQPLIGRIFGYGHFVFESAAQEQGLRDVRYVGRPNERDQSIQRVVQRSGLRGPRRY